MGSPSESEQHASRGGRRRALALQGGGCRTFFSLGVLATAGGRLGTFTDMAAVSASTGMACGHLLGIHGELVARFAARVRRNPRNFYPRRLLLGRRPTPHLEMYRETILECIDGDRLRALRCHATRLRFLVALGPFRSRTLSVALAAMTPLTKRPLGGVFSAHAVEIRSLRDPTALADAVLASSAFPPFTPVPRIEGRPALDGGVYESVPLSLLPRDCERVAILTRPTPWQPLPPSLRVISPREQLPVAMWDYADERAIMIAWDAGRRVGEEIAAGRVD
jgi:hypothetical protein